MKKPLLFTLLYFFVIISVSTCSAAPSINGSTGLIDNPSADVLREGQFAIGYYNISDGGAGVFNTNLSKGLEVGVAGFRFDNSSNNTFINTKYSLVSEGIVIPGIALGIEDIAGDRERTVYAVTSKTLPLGFRIHAGVGNGRYGGVFAALEKSINPISVSSGNNTFPATSLIAEFDGHNMNYGARVSVVPGLKIDAGWRDHDFYIGMSFTS